MNGREQVAVQFGKATVSAIDDFLEHSEMAERLLDKTPQQEDYETYFLALEAIM
jgi:hypothetical protein